MRAEALISLAFLAGSLSACDDATPAAVPDLGRADAGPDAEAQPLLRAGPLSLSLAEDGAEVILSVAEAPRARLSAAVVVAGETVALADLPELAWTTQGGEAVGRFGGDPQLPALVWTLTLDAEGLTAQLEAESTETLPLDARLPLRGQDLLAEGTRRLPAEPGPWVAATDEAPLARRHRQDLRSTDAVLRLLAPDALIETAADAFEVRFDDPQILALGGRATASARMKVAAQWRAVPANARPAAPTLGWATGPAHGPAASAALVSQGAAAVGLLFADLPGPRAVRLDGLFYAGPGDARVLPPVAADAAALVAAAAPAELWLRWPARHAPARLALLDEVPTARDPDGPACGAPACARLNPAVPAARDRSAREAALLARAGATRLWLPDTADLSGPQRAGWLAVLRDAAPTAELGRLDGPATADLAGALLPTPAGAPASPCAAAATTHPWPEACAAALTDLAGVASVAPTDDAERRRLAFALVGDAAEDRAGRAPPTLVWAGLDAAAQRQAAGLWLVAGGPVLLGDNLSNLQAFSPSDLAPLEAALALSAGGGEPLEPGDAEPPTRFAGPGYALAVNWSDAPLQWNAAPDLAVAAALAQGLTAAEAGAAPSQANEVFTGRATALADPLTVPPHDAVLLALPR